MGTEESIFTIMTYLDSYTYHYETINEDGLIYTFFEKLQDTNFKPSNYKSINTYIITFNSPNQLQMVLDSFEKYNKEILTQTNLIVINNTTNHTLYTDYDKIIQQYNITEIRKNNIGICGGRQFVAEHFAESNADYMIFFEDDMLLDFNGICLFGFNKNVPHLLKLCIKIMDKEGYDFLKFSFSEFYGHNGEQWSWHNVPGEKKIEYFGQLSQRPLTKFNNIKSLENIPYADGEIYYSNWPHIISQDGNKKCFMDTKWDHPYEQTWMSHIYTLTKENKVKPGILLASPVTHNRIHHYGPNERKEN
jgi:dihydrofolate reductase